MNGFGKDHATERSYSFIQCYLKTFAELCFVPGNELVVIFSSGFLAKANSALTQGPFVSTNLL